MIRPGILDLAFALFVVAVGMTAASVAEASCSTPTASAGAKEYTYTGHKYQWCDGTNWNDMPISGTIAGACTEGQWKFDTTNNVPKYCDNTPVFHSVACLRNYSYPDFSTPFQASEFTGSDSATNDKFGSKIAGYGQLVISGAPFNSTNVGAAYLFDVSTPSSPVQKSKLTASDAAASDFFGWSVAISSSYAVVGAYNKTVGANTGQGAVYLFDISTPASPVQKAKLTASDGVASDEFGYSVAIYNNLVFVGAQKTSTPYSSTTYIFDISTPTAPVQLAEVAHGGSGVVTNGRYLFVYDSNSNSYSGGTGTAYIYDIGSPSAPVYKSQISFTGYAYAVGVCSLAVSGNLLLVGSCYEYTTGTHGYVYAFDVSNPASPVQKSRFTNLDPPTIYFGWDVSLSGTTALVSVYKATGSSGVFNQGSAYIYDLSNPSSPVQISEIRPTDGASGDQFGTSVWFGGSAAFLSSPPKLVGANYSGVIYGFQFPTQAKCSGTTGLASWSNTAPQSSLIASDGASGDLFGYSLSISGNYALVGAYEKTVSTNSRQGQVYLYDISSPAAPVKKSGFSTGTANDYFGNSVSVSGALALIGSYQKQVGANVAQGAVNLYSISNPSSPSYLQYITASDGVGGDNFGNAVSLSGTVGLIGAANKPNGSNPNQGAVYVADVTTPASYTLTKILAPDGASTDFFGFSVAISGNLAIIGAYGKTIGTNGSQGAVYVYDVSTPTSPVYKARITPADGAANDYFGYSVSLSGTLAIIGADNKTVGTNASQGVVYVYDLSTPTSPVMQAEIVTADGAASDYFGYSVSLSGNLAAIGAYYKTVSSKVDQGVVYVYDLSTPTSPSMKAELTSSDGVAYDTFGAAVAAYGNVVMGAAPAKTVSSKTNQGEAYIFYPPCGSVGCATNGTCTSTYSQAVKGSQKFMSYLGTSYLHYCDGTNWIPANCGTVSIPTLPSQTNVALSTLTTSSIVLPTLSCDSTISISGTGSPQYRICSDSACSSVVQTWTSASHAISPNQFIQVELTSSASGSTTNSATITIGTATQTWNVTTWLGYKRVFVTSTSTYTGAIGSVASANSACQSLAQTAGLSGTWLAWIAVTTGTDDPATTFTRSTYPYKLVDGTTTVASNWTALTSGTLSAGITKTESGATTSGVVWTNVATNGTATSSGSNSATNCSGWTITGSGTKKGNDGSIGATGSTWTASSSQTCSSTAHLYCFEQ